MRTTSLNTADCISDAIAEHIGWGTLDFSSIFYHLRANRYADMWR